MNNDKLIEAMARAIEPETFELPRIQLYAQDYMLAYEKARAALQALREQEGWKPWATAGEAVGQKVPILFQSGYIEDATIYQDEDGGGIYYRLFDGEQLNDQPTYWMPLPAVPNQQEEVK